MEEVGDEKKTRSGAEVPSIPWVLDKDEGAMPDGKKKLAMLVLAQRYPYGTNLEENELM